MPHCRLNNIDWLLVESPWRRGWPNNCLTCHVASPRWRHGRGQGRTSYEPMRNQKPNQLFCRARGITRQQSWLQVAWVRGISNRKSESLCSFTRIHTYIHTDIPVYYITWHYYITSHYVTKQTKNKQAYILIHTYNVECRTPRNTFTTFFVWVIVGSLMAMLLAIWWWSRYAACPKKHRKIDLNGSGAGCCPKMRVLLFGGEDIKSWNYTRPLYNTRVGVL